MHYILSHFGGERLVIAAFAVGIMERLIELGIDYAHERRAFGSSLLGFQTWRHRFAEMATRLEATRALTYQAARLLSDGDPTAGSVIDPRLIRERIARLNRTRKVQIHCISIGKPSPFLRALAKENGGAYTESL